MSSVSKTTFSPVRRVLKRSASTASLLTPPRTYRRRGRGRSKGSCDSSSGTEVDEHALLTSDDEDLPRGRPELNASKNKKRKTDSFKSAEDDQEAAFWMDDAVPNTDEKAAESTTTTIQAPLIYRRLRSQSNAQAQANPDQALVSPPPSHRKPMIPASPSPATTTSTPVTPKPRTSLRLKQKATGALRDSPANPFLATPFGKDQVLDVDEDLGPAASPSPKMPYHDKPTVTYVFRGVKRVYQNPMYNHAKNKPFSPPPNSYLPVEDPMFSPDPTCPPKLLFPEAHKARKAAKGKGKAQAKASRGVEGDGEFEKATTIRKRGRGTLIDDEELEGETRMPDSGAGGGAATLTLEEELRNADAGATAVDPFC